MEEIKNLFGQVLTGFNDQIPILNQPDSISISTNKPTTLNLLSNLTSTMTKDPSWTNSPDYPKFPGGNQDSEEVS